MFKRVPVFDREVPCMLVEVEVHSFVGHHERDGAWRLCLPGLLGCRGCVSGCADAPHASRQLLAAGPWGAAGTEGRRHSQPAGVPIAPLGMW